MNPQSSSPLFTPFYIRDLRVANRIVMAPMTRARTTNAAAAPTDMHEVYYGQRSSAGLIVSEGLAVSADAIGGANLPGFYSNAQVAAWSRVTDTVHSEGAAIVAQLVHVGGVSHRDLLGGQLPWAPSSINPHAKVSTPFGRKHTEVPQAMSQGDILRTVTDYATAAANAIKAGFDGVEIHAHRGYLISQFLNPRLNARTDGYGGDLENRARFLREVVEAVTTAVGSRIVGIKFAPYWTEGENHVLDDDSTLAHDYIGRHIGGLVDYLHVMAPRASAWADFVAEDRIALLQRVRDGFSGIIMAGGGFDAESAEEVINAQLADAVAFGLPFVANPDLPARLARGIPWAQPDRASMYVGGAAGYIDYPASHDSTNEMRVRVPDQPISDGFTH